MDLLAAFDTVNHNLLRSILNEQYGITGEALKWIDSYLRPRGYCVSINSSLSTHKNTPFSVPQGSCLEPFLYLAYTGTLEDILEPSKGDWTGFADDHTLCKSFNPSVHGNQEDTIESLQNSLSKIKRWMDCCKLAMNTAKMEFVVFSVRAQPAKTNISSIDAVGDVVYQSTVVKYLGAYLDEQLKLDKHVTEKCKKATYNLYNIRKIRNSLTISECKTLVQGLVLSHLDYTNAIFVGIPKRNIQRLLKVQNMAAKLVLNRDKWSSSKESLKQLYWLPIQAWIDFKILVLTHKSLHGKAPEYLINKLELKTSMWNLWLDNDGKLLKVPKTKRKTFADRGFSTYAPKIWNGLPRYIRDIDDLLTFRKNLKTYIFKLYYT